MIEGSWARPSGRDLVTNFISSVVSIYLVHPLLNPGEVGDRAGPRDAAWTGERAVVPALVMVPEATNEGLRLIPVVAVSLRF